MTNYERGSIIRILSEFVQIGSAIDIENIIHFKDIRNKYHIQKNDEQIAISLTLSEAVKNIKNLKWDLKQDLLNNIKKIIFGNKHCTKQKSLLFTSLKIVLLNNESFNLLSYNSNISFKVGQIIYIESQFDKRVNRIISNNYRQIKAEALLNNFDFVYVPKLVEYYKELEKKDILKETLFFLYPSIPKINIQIAVKQLLSFSTDKLCEELLLKKIGIKEVYAVEPTLLIKISTSKINNKLYDNYLLLELSANPMMDINYFFDTFTSIFDTLGYTSNRSLITSRLNYQLFDLVLSQISTSSEIVVDLTKSEIYFPKVNAKLEGLHRKEKALYVLLLIESLTGGINFSKPQKIEQITRHERSTKRIQIKYSLIYERFGGDKNRTPHLDNPQIRLPMISLIRKQILELNHILGNIDDYIIQRNVFGNYSLNVSADKIFCIDWQEKEIKPLYKSSFLKEIISL